jgi:hypothetical protein
MENQQEKETTDLGTFLGRISRRIILRGELLRGLAPIWTEGDTEEFLEIISEMGVEITDLGRRLKLIQKQLCSTCQMKHVEESISIGKAKDKEDSAL